MKILWLAPLLFSLSLHAQNDDADFDSFDSEFKTSLDNSANAIPIENATTAPARRSKVDEELQIQKDILARKKRDESEVSLGEVNRFPTDPPLFKKPPGPTEGGTVRVPHPNAGKGLLKINKDGIYQYKTPLKEKTATGHFGVSVITPPKISSGNSNITFESMYGSNNLSAGMFSYEWQPFHGFGALGLQTGFGIATLTAKGNFKKARPDGTTQAIESYNLFIVPIPVFLNYRFEFVRRQWVVPFVNAGGIYYGMAEIRNDGKSSKLAGAPALGGGGGVLLSISRWDQAGAFALASEYGIADMWLLLQARAMKGLSEETDFTNQTLDAGIQVDF